MPLCHTQVLSIWTGPSRPIKQTVFIGASNPYDLCAVLPVGLWNVLLGCPKWNKYQYFTEFIKKEDVIIKTYV